MKNIYQEIFFSATKYVALRNVFLVITGVLSIFIVRFLGPQEYGKWALVYQLIATIGPIVSLGFLSTLAKFIPECQNNEDKNRLFSTTFFIVLIAFLIFAFFYFLGINLFPKIFPKEIKDVKYAFCIFIGALSLINLIEGFYRGLGKFNQWTVIDGSRSVLSAGLAILFMLIISPFYATIFYIYFLMIILFLAVVLLYLRNNISLNFNFNIDPKIIKFSLIILAGQIVFLLGTTIDSVLLRTLLKDPAQVGYYNAGIRIPKMLETMLIGPLAVPFLYYFSHHDSLQSRERILTFGMKMLGIIFGGISLFLFSFAKEIISLFFGQAYLLSAPVLRIFSLILFILGFTVLFSPYFLSLNKPLISVSVGFFTIVLIFIFNLLLIPHFKSVGPAVSAFFGLTIQALVMLYLLTKQNVSGYRDFIILFSCVMTAALAGFFINFFVSLPVFLILVFLTRLFTFKDIEIWKKVIIKKSIA